MADSIEMTENDTTPPLEFQLTDHRGPLNLTGASVVIRIYNRRTRSSRYVDGALHAPLTGVVRYYWLPIDTAEPGDFIITARVTFNDGTAQTYPGAGQRRLKIKPLDP